MKKILLFFMVFLLVVLISRWSNASETLLDDQVWINFYHDQPTYFLLGTPQTKAQVSFKAKFISSIDLYAAYTQRLFWDLFEKSSPFRDINYNPSVFYRFGNSKEAFDIIGYEHESNGQGAESSRSWDRTGVRYQTVYKSGNSHQLTWSARAWVPLNYDVNNPDLAQYRGVYEMVLTFSNFLGNSFEMNDLSLRIYPGGKLYINPLQGGRELTLRLKGRSPIFLVKAVFQIFQGLGENMLEYNKSIWGFRLGIGI